MRAFLISMVLFTAAPQFAIAGKEVCIQAMDAQLKLRGLGSYHNPAGSKLLTKNAAKIDAFKKELSKLEVDLPAGIERVKELLKKPLPNNTNSFENGIKIEKQHEANREMHHRILYLKQAVKIPHQVETFTKKGNEISLEVNHDSKGNILGFETKRGYDVLESFKFEDDCRMASIEMDGIKISRTFCDFLPTDLAHSLANKAGNLEDDYDQECTNVGGKLERTPPQSYRCVCPSGLAVGGGALCPGATKKTGISHYGNFAQHVRSHKGKLKAYNLNNFQAAKILCDKFDTILTSAPAATKTKTEKATKALPK